MNLPDELMRQVKAEAAYRGTTITALVGEALQCLLDERTARRKRVRLPVVSGRGPLPGVDLHDNETLAALAED